MADLRKAARGRECQVRIPGVCNGNSETSVLAHIRLTPQTDFTLNLTTSHETFPLLTASICPAT